MTGSLTIRNAEVDGRVMDVRVDDGSIRGMVAAGDRVEPGSVEIDARGGALLPGLHDHHVHLLAMAAAEWSTPVGPPTVTTAAALAAALRAAHARLPPGDWIRGVGYHDSVAGPIDRHWLDGLGVGRPVRIQHRSGALWILDSRALAAVGDDGSGVLERDPAGAPTGRIYRGDEWLRTRVPRRAPPLDAVGRRFIGAGVTGVTDLTPTSDPADLVVLGAAVDRGDLPLRVMVTGSPELPADARPDLARGPVKIVVDDHRLPDPAWVVGQFRAARRLGRPVAVHCVTRVGLVLALAAWWEVGSVEGDRIEHGAVIPVELIDGVRELGLVVVTQPGFVAERGDQYFAEVEHADQPHLWRCGSLLDAGVDVAFGSDAPYASPDPWRTLAAAVDRHTASGAVLGAGERVAATVALDRMLGDPWHPSRPRRLEVGMPADLCLLDRPLAEQLRAPTADAVVAAIVGGVVHDAAATRRTGG